MRKIGIIALLLVTVQSVSAQVSISASTSNGAGGQTVVQTDTIAGQRLWPDFHAVEVEGAMKVRFETADAEHPVGISYYANDFKAGKIDKFGNRLDETTEDAKSEPVAQDAENESATK